MTACPEVTGYERNYDFALDSACPFQSNELKLRFIHHYGVRNSLGASEPGRPPNSPGSPSTYKGH